MGLIIGGMIIAVGARMTWATVTIGSSPVPVPGFPRLVLAGGKVGADGSEVGVGYLSGAGLLIAVVALGWLVSGPRMRVVLAVAALAGAIAVGIVVVRTRSEVTPRAVSSVRGAAQNPNVELIRAVSGPGIWVTAAGAAVAALSAIAGGAAGRLVPRMRMPEPPDRGAAA